MILFKDQQQEVNFFFFFSPHYSTLISLYLGNNPPLIKTGVTAIHFGYDNIGGWSGDNWIATLKQHEV